MRTLTLIGLALLVGCAATINPYSNVTYTAPDGVSVDSMAVLPVVAGEGLEGFRRTTADSLEAKLKRQHPKLAIIPADTSLQRLNDAGLASEYNEMVQAYGGTGVLDAEILSKMADAVGAGIMLHAGVNYGADSDVTYGGAYVGAYETKTQDVGIFAHLWSADNGDVIWEASAGAESTSGWLTTDRKITEILNAATKELAVQFPGR